MRRFAVLLAALALLATVPAVAARTGSTSARSMDPAVAYWTKERIAHAIPRDFVRPAGGSFIPAARPPGGGGGGGVTGASWTGGGVVVEQSGRVLFTLGGTDYICSASVVDDTNANYSVIITAAHCAYDEVADVFATNWVYYPAFDRSPSYDCASAIYGCWSAKELVVHHGFADREAFDDVAVQYDWAFAVVGTGGKAGQNPQLDSHGSYAVAISTSPSTGYAFGYPAAGKYHGLDLTYCQGAIGTDPYNNNNNWKIACDMTGGSSGGPWLQDTSNPANLATEGRVFSLNSYGYNGIKAMHGPKFNANTTTSYTAAKSATPNPPAGTIIGLLVP
jgi:hypothetical protein